MILKKIRKKIKIHHNNNLVKKRMMTKMAFSKFPAILLEFS